MKVKNFNQFNESNNYDWEDFKRSYGLTDKDLDERKYSVDYDTHHCTLREFIVDNADAMMIDIMDLGAEIPISDIIDLKVGETKSTIGGFTDIEMKRIS